MLYYSIIWFLWLVESVIFSPWVKLDKYTMHSSVASNALNEYPPKWVRALTFKQESILQKFPLIIWNKLNNLEEKKKKLPIVRSIKFCFSCKLFQNEGYHIHFVIIFHIFLFLSYKVYEAGWKILWRFLVPK